MLDGTLADREFPGQVVDLPPESEEVAGFYAALLESDHAKDATFNKNFFDDFLKVLKKNPPVRAINFISFVPTLKGETARRN